MNRTYTRCIWSLFKNANETHVASRLVKLTFARYIFVVKEIWSCYKTHKTRSKGNETNTLTAAQSRESWRTHATVTFTGVSSLTSAAFYTGTFATRTLIKQQRKIRINFVIAYLTSLLLLENLSYLAFYCDPTKLMYSLTTRPSFAFRPGLVFNSGNLVYSHTALCSGTNQILKIPSFPDTWIPYAGPNSLETVRHSSRLSHISIGRCLLVVPR